MYIDFMFVQWSLLLAGAFCAFMVGVAWSNKKRDEVIEDTIVYLVENGFIRSEVVDGEIEILKLDDIDNT